MRKWLEVPPRGDGGVQAGEAGEEEVEPGGVLAGEPAGEHVLGGVVVVEPGLHAG